MITTILILLASLTLIYFGLRRRPTTWVDDRAEVAMDDYYYGVTWKKED